MVALLSVVSTTAWALSEVDGVYQIGTAADLKAFAELVNGNKPYANAVLTADIDKGTETYMIGRDGQDFQGVFDGAGHTITYNLTQKSGQGSGLFRNVGVHALIQNLKVQATINTDQVFAGGIAAWNSGRIRGCYVDVVINSEKVGDATAGGIVGKAYRGTVIENCLSKVMILGESTTNCGGVCGWADNKINVVNCLVVSDGSTFNYTDASNGHSCNIARNEGNLPVVNLETYNANPYANRPAGANYNNYVTVNWNPCNATTVVPLADLADGKVCYQLNNDQSKINWVQTIGTDPFPVPAAFGTGQVYASGATGCNGQGEGLTYSNEGTVQATAHTFDKYGICTACGCFNFSCFDEGYDMTDASITLKTASDLYLAEGWNRIGDGFKLNMKMANDITIEAPTGQLIFNNSNWVDGNFNGQGHALTYKISEVKENEASFIPQHTGIFENVILHGSIGTANQYAGSISGRGRQTIVRNVFSDVTINTTRTGDNTTGGLFGIGYNAKSVDNCIYAGSINGVDGTQCIAGFCGWADGKTTFNNCAFLGTLNNAGGDSHTISRNPNNATGNNVYSLNEYNNTDAGKYTTTTTEQIASGELAFLLNGSQNGLERFYQVIGTDPEPMPFAKEGGLVYAIASEYRCDGIPLSDDVTYTNDPEGINIPDHEFEEGICKNCGFIEEDADGYKKIINAQTLIAFSELVNTKGEASTKARMYADIDMEGITDYYPIGNEAHLYVGEFDGQFHTISKLVINNGGYDYQGLFGRIGGGADIKNFVLDNTCSITGNAFCGVIGGTNGSGNVYITNVGNEGPVTGNAQNASGIIGVDMDGSATMFITNCYVMGAVKGARESATICSWSNASSVVKNCWSIATLEGKYGNEDSFTRGSAACVNCYEVEGVGTQNNKTGTNRTNLFAADEVASGSLCAKLGTGSGWYQKVGEDAHPVWDENSGFVVEITDAGYATMYLPAAVEAPEGVSVFTGEYEETWLKLNPVEGTVPANEPVVLKGEAGFYSFVPAEAAVETDELTWQALGLPGTNSNYTEFSGISFTSAAEYAGLASSGTGQYIQLRSKNSNEGIITTASGGKLKSLTIAYNAGTDSRRVLDIYAKNEPYEAASDLYNETLCGEKIGSIAYAEGTLTFTVEGDYQYVGIRSNYGALYLDELSFEWEGSVSNIEGNVLIGADEDVTANGSQYILAMPEGKQVGFWKSTPGTTIKAGKAYLEPETTGETTGVKAFFFSGDDATGIANVEKTIENGIIYNIAGQRISKMQKGINIVNGKKVLK
jgi:hypothetical protein